MGEEGGSYPGGVLGGRGWRGRRIGIGVGVGSGAGVGSIGITTTAPAPMPASTITVVVTVVAAVAAAAAAVVAAVATSPSGDALANKSRDSVVVGAVPCIMAWQVTLVAVRGKGCTCRFEF